jgi:small nuclear ribonucleoprotein (snRNP)-like protein
VWVPFPFPRSSEREIAMITLRSAKKTNKQEYVNGQLKNKYGDAFVRGNNVLYISAVKDK